MWCDVMCHDYCRYSYMPDDIKVLFVGESPPAGGDFFYFGVGNLFNNTKQAFENVLGIKFKTSNGFLNFFKCCSCYLEDLIPIPGLGVPTSKNINLPGSPFPTLLDWCIERFKHCWLDIGGPRVIIVILKRVFDKLMEIFDKYSVEYIPVSDGSKLKNAWKERKIIVFTDDFESGPLPFPAFGHQEEYVKNLEKILRKLRDASILKI